MSCQCCGGRSGGCGCAGQQSSAARIDLRIKGRFSASDILPMAQSFRTTLDPLRAAYTRVGLPQARLAQPFGSAPVQPGKLLRRTVNLQGLRPKPLGKIPKPVLGKPNLSQRAGFRSVRGMRAFGAFGAEAGAVGAASDIYSEARTYQSGATGSDALSGAESGAAVGTMIVPGIGTAIGAIVGGAIGALSSAFGGGKADPETESWDAFVPAYATNPQIATRLSAPVAFQLLAGVMDAKNDTAGHAEPIEVKFGREAEASFMVQMMTMLNQATSAGNITAAMSSADVFNEIVIPWLASEGAAFPATQNTSKGVNEVPALKAVLTQLVFLWFANDYNASTAMGIGGQPISGLPKFVGFPTAAPAASTAPAPSTPAKTAPAQPVSAPAQPVQPAMPSTILTADGADITASGTALKDASGELFYFGAAPAGYTGKGLPVWVMGAQNGALVGMLLGNCGNVYGIDSQSAWYEWSGTGWNSLSGAPAFNPCPATTAPAAVATPAAAPVAAPAAAPVYATVNVAAPAPAYATQASVAPSPVQPSDTFSGESWLTGDVGGVPLWVLLAGAGVGIYMLARKH